MEGPRPQSTANRPDWQHLPARPWCILEKSFCLTRHMGKWVLNSRMKEMTVAENENRQQPARKKMICCYLAPFRKALKLQGNKGKSGQGNLVGTEVSWGHEPHGPRQVWVQRPTHQRTRISTVQADLTHLWLQKTH